MLGRLVCAVRGHTWQRVRRPGSRVVVCLRCGLITERDGAPETSSRESHHDEDVGEELGDDRRPTSEA